MCVAPSNLTCPIDGLAMTTKHMRILLIGVPDTKSETLFGAMKHLLIRCNLPLEHKAAIPVHCFSHSLNLCLQGTGKTLVCLWDAIEIVKDIYNLIHSLFSQTTSLVLY